MTPVGLFKKVTATVVVCDSSRSKNAQKSRDGENSLLCSTFEGDEKTERLAVALLSRDVLRNSAVPVPEV